MMLELVVISISGHIPEKSIEAIFYPRSIGTIGLSSESNLVLLDPDGQISRTHANVIYMDGRWLIIAIGQTEFYLNGEKISRGQPLDIKDGDKIHVGNYLILVRIPPRSTSSTPTNDTSNEVFSCITPPTSESLLADLFDSLSEKITKAAEPPGSMPLPKASLSSIKSSIEQLLGDISDWGLPASIAPDDLLRQLDTNALKSDTSDVSLGAAAPSECKHGIWFVANFTAYPPNKESVVHSLLSTQNPSAAILLGKRSCRWALGTNVLVKLQAEYFEIENSVQFFTWNDCIESLDFRVRATDKADESSVLQFTAHIEGFTIATLCLNIRVGQMVAKSMTKLHINPARTAFASYSSADRPLVLQMVGAIERSAGMDVFLDCLDLMASEEWKPRLAREIANRDQFLLFWSNRSRRSQWVKWELNEALQKKSTVALQLHPIEPDIPLPNEIAHLHAGSIHALVANYYSKKPWWSRAWKIIRSSIK